MKDRKSSSERHQDLAKVENLVKRVQGGSLDAGVELFRFVMETAEPYLQSTVTLEDVEAELENVVSVTWDAIRDGALLKPEFLPSFVQTLIWQQVRHHLQRNQAGEPEPGLFLVPDETKRRADPPADPLLAPQT
jgi:hypothetical protein